MAALSPEDRDMELLASLPCPRDFVDLRELALDMDNGMELGAITPKALSQSINRLKAKYPIEVVRRLVDSKTTAVFARIQPSGVERARADAEAYWNMKYGER